MIDLDTAYILALQERIEHLEAVVACLRGDIKANKKLTESNASLERQLRDITKDRDKWRKQARELETLLKALGHSDLVKENINCGK